MIDLNSFFDIAGVSNEGSSFDLLVSLWLQGFYISIEYKQFGFKLFFDPARVKIECVDLLGCVYLATHDKLSEKSIIVRGNLFGDFFVKVSCCSSETAEHQLSIGKVFNQHIFILQLLHYFSTTRVSWIQLKKLYYIINGIDSYKKMYLILLCNNRIIV